MILIYYYTGEICCFKIKIIKGREREIERERQRDRGRERKKYALVEKRMGKRINY